MKEQDVYTGWPETGPQPVLVLMGSTSDWSVMQHTCLTLRELGLGHAVYIASAHRTPERVEHLTNTALENGYKFIICGAGLAAALPGDVAARTNLPVVGVAIPGTSPTDEMAALLSMTKMPPGTPVGFTGLGKPGAINAALFAAQILGLGDHQLQCRLANYRRKQSNAVPEHPPALPPS